MSRPEGTLRTGTTLLELMLVLAVMGVATSVVALTATPTRAADSAHEVRRTLRNTAILQGRDTTVHVIERGRLLLITARPTGQLLEDTVRTSGASTPVIHAR